MILRLWRGAPFNFAWYTDYIISVLCFHDALLTILVWEILKFHIFTWVMGTHLPVLYYCVVTYRTSDHFVVTDSGFCYRWAFLALACVGARICSGLLVAGWCGVQFAVWYVWSMLRTFVTLDLCILDYVLLSMWLYYGLEPLTHVCLVLMYVLMIWRVRVAFPVYIIVVCRAGCINLGVG